MKRKSAAEKKAAGTYRASRDKRVPQFVAATTGKAPSYIRKNKLAHAEWNAVVPFLVAEGILKETDISLLASYCLLYARWREAAADVEKNGLTLTVTSQTRTGISNRPVVNPSVRSEVLYQAAMMRSAVKFGLNPLDRSRLEVGPFDRGGTSSSLDNDDDLALYSMPEGHDDE